MLNHNIINSLESKQEQHVIDASAICLYNLTLCVLVYVCPSSLQKFFHSWGNAPFLPPARRKHEVEVVANILVEVGHKVVVVAKVEINLVIIIVVCIDVIIDVDDQGDNCSNKAHVAESIRPTCHAVTSKILAFLCFLLKLVNSLGGDILRSEHNLVLLFYLIILFLPFSFMIV